MMTIHEALEARRLLSISLSGGLLRITGTPGNDSFTVRQEGTALVVDDNIKIRSYPVADVQQLSIDMRGGDDFLRLRTKANTRNVTAPATLLGGDGNDTLRGGLANDSIDGGAGDDVIDGGSGADTLRGGTGNDTTDYSQRTKPLFIKVDGAANSGEAGENDRLDTERVIGGSGDDLFMIASDDSGNAFFGGAGNDAVDYASITSATEPVKILLDNKTNDGVHGADNIHDDIETVFGTKFADSITGSNGDNTLVGGDGADTINGDLNQTGTTGPGGDDLIIGGSGDDSLDGNFGVDSVIQSDAPDPTNVDAHDHVGYSYSAAEIFLGSIGSPDFFFSQGDPYLGPAQATARGTPGDDVIIITEHNGVVAFDINGKVTHKAGLTSIYVSPGAGNDLVVLSKFDGTNPYLGRASIYGEAGDDTIRGGAGNDHIDAGDGNDLVFGNEGDDFLFGGKGDDTLKGGAGNDKLVGKEGNDDLDGGPGIDTADYTGVKFPLAITLDDDLANDGDPVREHDNVHSNVENVLGGLANDRIVGNNSDNFLYGGPGNDSLRGGDGNDVLIGGAGLDTLKGIAGRDTFGMFDGKADIFDAPLNSGADPFADFLSGDPGKDFSTASNATLG